MTGHTSPGMQCLDIAAKHLAHCLTRNKAERVCQRLYGMVMGLPNCAPLNSSAACWSHL
jgi:hypothetical protein